MNDREEIKLRSAWKKLEESFNSIAEGDPTVPIDHSSYVMVDEESITINSVQEVPGSRQEEGEGPSGDGWNEPHEPGYYYMGFQVMADVTFGVVTGEKVPVSMEDGSRINEIVEELKSAGTDTMNNIIDYAMEEVEGGVKVDTEGWGVEIKKIEPIGGNKVHMVITFGVSTDEAPEVEPDIPDEDWGDERFEEKRKLLGVAGKLLKEASRHLK